MHIPNFAPLNQDMVLFLLQEAHTSTIQANEQTRLHFLQQQVEALRLEVYHQLMPFLGALTSQWLCETLGVTSTTLTRWRQQGILLYKEKNGPDPQSVAAILIMRRLLKKQRCWLPTQARDGFQWQCWRQDDPQAPITPCSIPLSTVPKHALLWTTWLGAAWEPCWICLDDLGCARWGQSIIMNNTPLWNLDESDLKRWSDTYTSPSTRLAPLLRRHHQATMLLLDLAEARLLPPSDTVLSSRPE